MDDMPLYVFLSSVGFDVSVPQPVLKPVEEEPFQNTARFQYVIKPWPPPCAKCWPDNGDLVVYEHVRFTFRKHVGDGSTKRTLCVVEYNQGVYDEATGRVIKYSELCT